MFKGAKKHTHMNESHDMFLPQIWLERSGLVGMFTSQLFNKKIIVCFQPPDPGYYIYAHIWSMMTELER